MTRAVIFAVAASPSWDGRGGAILYALVAALIVAIIYGTVKRASRHLRMTEEEYEAEAHRASGRGRVYLLHKIFDPSHRAQHVQEQSGRVRADEDRSGDKPKAGR